MRNIWKGEADRTRCDWPMRQQLPPMRQQLPTPTMPQIPHPLDLPQEVPQIRLANPAPIVATATPMKLNDLARRSPSTEECRKAYTVNTYEIPLSTRPKDFRRVQAQWKRFLSELRTSCCQKFWEIFLPVHTFPVNVIDTVLRATKRTFLAKNSAEWKHFPSSRRTLLDKAGSVGDFWPAVLHTCRIDLTGVLTKPLVSGTRSLTFEFLDPVWAWLSVARDLPPEDLHWRPAAQSPLDPVYGGGVQFGECFREACRSCPPGGYPMGVGLHWDGTSGGGISSAPICIEVMNTNNCGAETQCCIGYMPKTPDQARKEFAKTPDCTKLKFHIRQECCRAILRVLEAAAISGVICGLFNRLHNSVDRLLFPRLFSMNFDQPEAQLFFGEMGCQKCSLTVLLTLKLLAF